MEKWRDLGKNLRKPPCKVVPVIRVQTARYIFHVCVFSFDRAIHRGRPSLFE